MKLWRAVAGGLFGAFLIATPAASQPGGPPPGQLAPRPGTPQVQTNQLVQIAYAPPRSQKYQEIYERLQKYRVLELLQEFLSPLRLPRPLQVTAAECGALDMPYEPGKPVVICYEFMREIEVNAPASKVVVIGPLPISKSAIVIGAAVNLVLNRVSYAVLDMLQVPVWGRQDDAADNISALVMLEFRRDPIVIWATLAGTSWLLAQRSFIGAGSFSEVIRGAEAQRFYNYSCMAYGAYPKLFQFLVANGDLPKRRADRCDSEYRKVKRAFMQTIMPNVDQIKLKQARELNWAARMQLAD